MTLKQRLERLEKALETWNGCPACGARKLVLTEDAAEAERAAEECVCGGRAVILVELATDPRAAAGDPGA